MATEVVLSPKRNIMDFFKTPTKVSDASSSSKKSQGILGFFTSTPRTPKSSVSSASTPSSAKLKKMSTSYDTDVQVIETVSEKEKQYSIKLSLDAKSDMCSGQSKSMQVESTEKPLTGSSSNKQKSKLKTNKPGKKKNNFEPSAVETTCSADSQENVDSKESFTKKDEDAVHEQMDYEEFKRVLLQGQSKQPATDITVEIDEVSGMKIPDEGEEKDSVEKGKLAEKEPSPVDVADGDEKTREKDKGGREQTPNESKLADNSGNPDTDAEKRPMRTRTRRSMQPMIIPSPVLSPTSSKSSKKDDSDLSLHGRDILEMTYEEYLKSIGAFDRSDTSNNESASNAEHTLEEKTENAVASASSTPSLYNFFSKTTKSTKQDYKQEGSTKVTVSAVVHGEPTVNRAMAIRERAKNALRLNKAAALEKHTKDKEDEIEVLGSETIIVDKSKEKTPFKTKQHKAEDECPRLTSASTSNLKNTEDGFSTAVQAENSLCTSSPVLTPDKIAKKTQATLQFRKGGGLEMSAPVAKPSVSKVETPTACSEDNTPVKTCKATLKKPVKRQRITEDDSDSSCAEIKASPAKETPAVKAQQKTRLRAVGRRSLESDSGNEAKEFTPRSKRASTAAQARAQELLMKARQQADLYKAGKGHQQRKSSSSLAKKQAAAITPAVKPKPSPSSAKQQKSEESKQSPAASKQKLEEEESASTSPGSRRQSSRLAQQQREQKTYINLDLESESDDSSSQPIKKKKTKKKDSDCCTPEKASKKSPQKAAGKLAPIFTKLKAGEAEEKAPPRPPEDPELVRKRREFLMSGVPTELKRQAETAAVQTVVASEYAPFPVVSHVQQRETVTSGGVDVWSQTTEKRLKLHDDLLVDIPAVNLGWKNLKWECVLGQKGDSVFTEPSQCDRDAISVEQRKLLLRELQQTDPGFAFAALYDKFKARFDAAGQEGKDISQEETQGPQLTKQQSLEDSDVVVVDEKEETTLGPSDKVLASGCQWTETLQPAQASEIVGNTVVLKRLRNWLEEWKALIQKEARHTARIAANISDFETSDSEGEESNQLCNTVLLVGPHGVGKTSAIYALAQQLSYKVFEVNASSSRQGRHILAQLQEATQSHQVAQKKDGVVPTILPAGLTSSKNTDAAPGEKEPKKAVSLVPNAFANFFKKGTVGAETGKKAAARESPKKDGVRKKKRPLELDSDASQSPKKLRKIKGKGTKPQSSQDAADNTLAGCLNLTSTSLILFDEVDLVFEEDTGFLQTVQHFINTTKIPIIMTTTDPTFGRAINAKFEQLIFKAPKLESVTRHLQTVLLAAGLRTCPEDVKALATTCQGDLRRALLTLQFFALSGGGANTEPRPLLRKPSHKENCGNEASPFLSALSATEQATCSVASSVADGADSEDDFEFISLRTARKPQRRIIDEDDDGKDAANTDSVSERGTGGVTGKSGDEEVNASALPPVHMHLYKSLLGVSHDLQSLLVKCLREPFSQSSVTLLVNECLKLKTYNLDVLQPNLLPLLPLPKVRMPDKWQPPSIPAAKTNRKRIRIADLWDSEISDEEDGRKSVSRFQLTELRGSLSAETEASLENADAVMTREKVESDSVDADGGRVDVTQENKAQVDVKSETLKISVKTEAVDMMTQSLATVHAIDQKIVDTEDQTSQSKSTPQVLNYSGRNQLDRRDSGLSSKLLSDFAHFYETLSAVDTFVPSSDSHGDFGLDRFVLLPGIQDLAPHRHIEESDSELGTEIGVEGRVYAARHLWQTVDMDTKAWREKNRGDALPDGCCIPLLEENAPVSLMLQPGAEDIRVPERYQSVMNTVVSNLPLTCYHGLRPVSLQYLPTLRAITQAEHNRQVAKTKRRFHHYFDNIGLCLNKPTMTALCDEFPAGQDNSN